MKNVVLIVSACMSLLLFSTSSNAWSGAGHQVIAAEAYRQLSPALQAKVTELLKSHPITPSGKNRLPAILTIWT